MMLEPCVFIVREQPRACQEAHAAPTFEREHSSAAGHDVDDELRVLPVLELRIGDVERRATDESQMTIPVADDELLDRETHRRASVATASRLMKQHQAVIPHELDDQPDTAASLGVHRSTIYRHLAMQRQGETRMLQSSFTPH